MKKKLLIITRYFNTDTPRALRIKKIIPELLSEFEIHILTLTVGINLKTDKNDYFIHTIPYSGIGKIISQNKSLIKSK